MRDDDTWDDPRGAEVYAEVTSTGVLYRELARGLLELVDPRHGDSVLDLACGSGLVSGMLYGRVGAEGCVVGFDRSPAMLRIARRHLPFAEVAFLRADPADLPLASRAFDGAACSAALWHFPALGRVFEETARVLSRGARFAFNLPAAQIEGVESRAPAPLMAALAREGELRFGRPPEPAGPRLDAARLESLAREAGLRVALRRDRDICVSQAELRALIEVPAFSARLYPEAGAVERAHWTAAAAERVESGAASPIRWREYLLERG